MWWNGSGPVTSRMKCATGSMHRIRKLDMARPADLIRQRRSIAVLTVIARLDGAAYV